MFIKSIYDSGGTYIKFMTIIVVSFGSYKSISLCSMWNDIVTFVSSCIVVSQIQMGY